MKKTTVNTILVLAFILFIVVPLVAVYIYNGGRMLP